MANARIKAIDKTSVHQITSSQVVVDLQTAVKELVENALDAGATTIEVKIKDNGVKSVEVVDNGSGIAKDDYDTVALKHHTSKLSTFEDLSMVETFGFRGEALASLCALCETVTITTSTSAEAPMGSVLELDRSGRITNKDKRVARQRGTTVAITGLFIPLPVRRKEFERHAKREYGKALSLLTAYALIPCTADEGVKLTVSHISDSGKKSLQIQTDGSTNLKNSITALWGSKAMDNIVPLNLNLDVESDSAMLKRRGLAERSMVVKMTGLVSKFAVGAGRSSNDRQFFFVNKRPCNLPKVQKAFNEIYKTFNATQSPFIVVDFALPTDACDINVSPDKRTIFLHSEHNLIEAMKAALVQHFEDSRSIFTLQPIGTPSKSQKASTRVNRRTTAPEPTPISSSPDRPISIPSSDPLPTTQPVTLINLSSDAAEDQDSPAIPAIEPAAPSRSTSGGGGLGTRSSKLVDNMSPSPPSAQADDADEEPVLRPTVSRKRAASRSPMSSPARPARTSVVPGGSGASGNPRKPVQMILSTEGASWSLSRGHVVGASSKGAGKGSLWAPNTRSPTKKSTATKTLSQFARGANPETPSASQEVMVISDTEDEEETKVKAPKRKEVKEIQATKPVVEMKSRASSRSSRASMRIDSPPSTPESTGDVQAAEELPEASEESTAFAKRSSSGDSRVIKPKQDHSSTSTPEDDAIIDLTQEASIEGIQIDTEVGKEEEAITLPMTFNLDDVASLWDAASSRRHAETENQQAAGSLANVVVVPQSDNPEELLSRVIQKEDFERMEILGQFNLGFIIVRSRRAAPNASGGNQAMEVDGDVKEEEMDDLFIVDQHAADEKYNFETLQLTTRIESQRLIRARPLDLSASDKLVALENLEVLQGNGFEVELEGAEVVDETEGRGQLLLVSQPVSKSTVFDMSDLAELLHLMQDKPVGTMVRCSKARAMFASRACRKSVMVGHPLTKSQMTLVVRHMSTMDQPWNCPHGRPTMRHLMRMSSQPVGSVNGSRKVDWSSLQE